MERKVSVETGPKSAFNRIYSSYAIDFIAIYNLL